MSPAARDLKGRQSMSSKKPMPGYVWLLAGLAIGLFFAFLVYLDKQPEEQVSFTQAVKQELQKVKDARQEEKQPNAVKKNTADSKEPRFDFYTILPELEVFIPEPEISKPPKNIPSINNQPMVTGKQYLLQAGSFRNNDDAERLKASLALLGVQSSIQNVSIKNDTWHRVRIGPFNDTKSLHETLSTLKQNNIHAMTMELK
ncbi:MAG: SPOR domain-containing protein [Gammaproteobacteria bacterium]|nr:SPOR domain-containing protein [Gammaproteobacteria bacterium]